MDVTFGIITAGDADDRINRIIDSIEYLEIPKYEVLIIGNAKVKRVNTRVIEFTEMLNGQGWITKKKNLIIYEANYEVIVFMHDYFIFCTDWFTHLKNSKSFDVAMSAITGPNGERYRDWVIWPHNENVLDLLVVGHRCLIPYDIDYLTEFMYISGAFWISTKRFMSENLLNESLMAGDGEDVEWSLRIRNSAKIVMLNHTRVLSLKANPIVFYGPGRIRESVIRLAKFQFFKSIMGKPVRPRTISKFRSFAELCIALTRKFGSFISLLRRKSRIE